MVELKPVHIYKRNSNSESKILYTVKKKDIVKGYINKLHYIKN